MPALRVLSVLPLGYLRTGFLLHRVARDGAGAGVVVRALVFERVDHAEVLVGKSTRLELTANAIP